MTTLSPVSTVRIEDCGPDLSQGRRIPPAPLRPLDILLISAGASAYFAAAIASSLLANMVLFSCQSEIESLPGTMIPTCNRDILALKVSLCVSAGCALAAVALSDTLTKTLEKVQGFVSCSRLSKTASNLAVVSNVENRTSSGIVLQCIPQLAAIAALPHFVVALVYDSRATSSTLNAELRDRALASAGILFLGTAGMLHVAKSLIGRVKSVRQAKDIPGQTSGKID